MTPDAATASPTGPSSSDLRRPQFETYCHTHLGHLTAPRLAAWRALSGGWEHEVYAVDIEVGPADGRRTLPLVLRVNPRPNGPRETSRDFDVLSRLADADFPAPCVEWIERSAAPIGAPFLLLERIDGLPARDLMPQLAPGPREELRARYCALLATLHRLDWRPFVTDDTGDPERVADALLAGERVAATRTAPDLLPVLDWLETHRSDAAGGRIAVLHGDPHLANVLVRPDGAVVAIDWSGSRVGDPRIDLGRAFLLVRAYGNAERHDRFVDTYAGLAGPVVHLEWFEVLAGVQRLRELVELTSVGPAQAGWRHDLEPPPPAHLAAVRQIAAFVEACTGVPVGAAVS